jgi:hypothetical protein
VTPVVDSVNQAMNNGKLLRITDERSVYILENEDGSYVSETGLIRYRNIGPSFDTRMIQESYTDFDIKTQSLHVLDEAGKSKWHIPAVWLDTLSMKILELQELTKDLK